MGGFFQGLFSLLTGNTVSRALDIALEKTEDVDKRNALVIQFVTIKEETRRAELARVTIPWVDAAHKMGRQIFWLASMVAVVVLIATGHSQEIMDNAQLLMSISGGGGLYTLLKGRGA